MTRDNEEENILKTFSMAKFLIFSENSARISKDPKTSETIPENF